VLETVVLESTEQCPTELLSIL